MAPRASCICQVLPSRLKAAALSSFRLNDKTELFLCVSTQKIVSTAYTYWQTSVATRKPRFITCITGLHSESQVLDVPSHFPIPQAHTVLTALPNRAADTPHHAVTWASRHLHKDQSFAEHATVTAKFNTGRPDHDFSSCRECPNSRFLAACAILVRPRAPWSNIRALVNNTDINLEFADTAILWR